MGEVPLYSRTMPRALWGFKEGGRFRNVFSSFFFFSISFEPYKGRQGIVIGASYDLSYKQIKCVYHESPQTQQPFIAGPLISGFSDQKHERKLGEREGWGCRFVFLVAQPRMR